MLPEGIFLELEKLHHQASQCFIGRSIGVNILQDRDRNSTAGGMLQGRKWATLQHLPGTGIVAIYNG